MVLKQKGDMPVYDVKPENEPGRIRTLHRNHLLPCEFLAKDEREVPNPRTPHRRVTRSQRRSPNSQEHSDDSSADEDVQFSIPGAQNQPMSQDSCSNLRPEVEPFNPEPRTELLNPGPQMDDTTPATPDNDGPRVEPSIATDTADGETYTKDNLETVEDSVLNPDVAEEPEEHMRRTRRPPTRFTYDVLGEPGVHNVQHEVIPPGVSPSQPPFQGPHMSSPSMPLPSGWTWLPQLQRFVWVPPISLPPSLVHMYPLGATASEVAVCWTDPIDVVEV